MEPTLTTRAAILQALYDGPGYGSDLIERLRGRAPGMPRLGPGTAYPALRALEREGLTRSWKVVPGGRRGARARVYYELTVEGVVVAEAQRKALVALVAARITKPSAQELRRMRERLRSCAEVSAFVLNLRRRMRAVTSR